MSVRELERSSSSLSFPWLTLCTHAPSALCPRRSPYPPCRLPVPHPIVSGGQLERGSLEVGFHLDQPSIRVPGRPLHLFGELFEPVLHSLQRHTVGPCDCPS